jgi:hypothetical protein
MFRLIMMLRDNDRELIVTTLIIIGAFLIGETFLKKVILSLNTIDLSPWILPIYGIFLLIIAFQIKGKEIKLSSLVFAILVIYTFVGLYFMRKGNLNPNHFLSLSAIILLVYLIVLFKGFFSNKKNTEKTIIKKNQKEEDKPKEITINWSSILTLALVIVGLLQVAILYNQAEITEQQNKIMKEQTEILKLSSPPFDPSLRIYFKYGESQFLSVRNLANPEKSEIFYVCIKNIGQTSTEHIFYHWKNNWSHNSWGNNIHPGIQGGELNCMQLKLTAKNCLGDLTDMCTKEIIPRGWVNLSLYLRCDGCIQRERIHNFKVCIWENSLKECEENETSTNE